MFRDVRYSCRDVGLGRADRIERAAPLARLDKPGARRGSTLARAHQSGSSKHSAPRYPAALIDSHYLMISQRGMDPLEEA